MSAAPSAPSARLRRATLRYGLPRCGHDVGPLGQAWLHLEVASCLRRAILSTTSWSCLVRRPGRRGSPRPPGARTSLPAGRTRHSSSVKLDPAARRRRKVPAARLAAVGADDHQEACARWARSSAHRGGWVVRGGRLSRPGSSSRPTMRRGRSRPRGAGSSGTRRARAVRERRARSDREGVCEQGGQALPIDVVVVRGRADDAGHRGSRVLVVVRMAGLVEFGRVGRGAILEHCLRHGCLGGDGPDDRIPMSGVRSGSLSGLEQWGGSV